MTSLATAFVTIRPDTADFGARLSSSVGSSADRAGAEAGKRMSARFKNTLKIGGLLAGAFAAAKVKDFLGDAVKEARESQKVGALTTSVIKSTGGAAQVTAKHVGALATALSNKTGIDDETIQSGQNMLLTFKNIRNEAGKGNKIFDQSTKTLVDLSSAMGTEPKQAAIQLGKALNDPIKGITALTRVGVTFDDQQKKQIKRFVESGHTMEAQKIILKELNSEFGGAAAAQATAGEKLSTTWKNFEEQVGTALLPIIDKIEKALTDKVIPALSQFFQQMQNGTGAGGRFAHNLQELGQHLLSVGKFIVHNREVIVPFVATMLTAVGVIKTIIAISKAWKAVQTAMNIVLAANPISLVIIALAALAAGLVYAYKHSETFRKIVQGAWHGIQVAAAFAWNNVLKPTITGLWKALQWVGDKFSWLWSNAVRPALKFIVDAFMNVVGDILHGAAKMLGWVPGVGGKLKAAAAAFDRFRANVNDALNGIHDRDVYVHVKASAAAISKNPSLNKPRVDSGSFASGGFTGRGGKYEPAGIVHRGEYVIPAEQTKRFLPLLRAIHRGYASGGLVDLHADTGQAGAWFGRFSRGANSSIANYGYPDEVAILRKRAAAAARAHARAAGGPSAGPASAGSWTSVILRVLDAFGKSHSWLSTGLHRLMVESGGNPTIVNKWDSNWAAGHPSVGGFQVIGPTFRAYAGPYRNTGPFEYGVSTNKLANTYAAVNYALHRYGVPFVGGTSGYDSGGIARGIGFMPKRTLRPERVLSPRQTESFDRLVTLLERGNVGGPLVNIEHLTATDERKAAQAMRVEAMRAQTMMRLST